MLALESNFAPPKFPGVLSDWFPIWVFSFFGVLFVKGKGTSQAIVGVRVQEEDTPIVLGAILQLQSGPAPERMAGSGFEGVQFGSGRPVGSLKLSKGAGVVFAFGLAWRNILPASPRFFLARSALSYTIRN